MRQPTYASSIARVLHKPGFWIVLILLLLVSIPYYNESLKYPVFLNSILESIGLERYAFEIILYLIPIIWAGLFFGWKMAFITSIVALVLMLSRWFILSPFKIGAIFEILTVIIVGNLTAFSFTALRKMREQNIQIKKANSELQQLYQEQKIFAEELRLSEQKYREVFENANDAIWIHDMEGNVLNANRATEALTGYSIEELAKMNINSFFRYDDKKPAQIHEQSLIRKDGSKAIIQVTTSQIIINNTVKAFQHIARDVSEERRLQRNLRYYSQQVTRAQEEERKRISRELHDETIQSLVVLSRNLDSLASGNNELSEKTRLQMEELRQETNNIMGEVRRLSQDLRPAALDRLGLRSALELLANDTAQYSGINTKVSIIGTERRLPEEIELVLFRITQEALRNAWRHSKATNINIVLEYTGTLTSVKIQDNGVGFDVLKATGELGKEGRFGLAGMNERARLIGGVLTVESEVGKGTTITIEVPFVI